jgi:acetyl esterase/lipase
MTSGAVGTKVAMAAALLAAASVSLVLPSARPAGAAPAVPEKEMLDAAALLATQYRVEPNIVYLTAGKWDGKLDLYLPRRTQGAGSLPAVINLHGGGWVTGDKDEIALDVLPYLAMGFAVVNADYRTARLALAPAAVEDCRCVLRWVIRHAAQYGLDPHRLVLAGSSAGAHLALMTALVPPSAGFDGLCPGDEELRVAAVINFFGVSDVADLLTAEHRRDFAVGWVGDRPDREKIARWVSPLTYLVDRMPSLAVLTVHGDADPVVPYEQAVRLHAALDRLGAPNRLYTVHGGRHGDFSGDEVLRLTHLVREFLGKQRILPPAPPAPLPGPPTARRASPGPARM